MFKSPGETFVVSPFNLANVLYPEQFIANIPERRLFIRR